VSPPKYPIGEYAPEPDPTPEAREATIADLARLPADLRGLVDRLTADRLAARYVNWTVRQIINHLADSHLNAHARFRLALTEDNPTIKPYDESAWARLPDADGDPAPSLLILDGLHARWAGLLRAMTPADFARTFFHPEANATQSLGAALGLYAWHGRHHLGQIRWLADRHGW